MAILKAEGLVKSYKKRAVVNGISFDVAPGEIVGLLGKNGAGKTTSFYMMVGLIRPNAGRVMLDDQDITRMPMYKRAQHGIGYLSQENSAFRKLTAEENIMLVLEMQKGLTANDRKERMEALIEKFKIGHVRKSPAQVLSGGERRRVEIARVLATEPKFILLDEPFTGIDPQAIEELQLIVADLKSSDIGVLITDHHVEVTLEITDRAYIVSEGKIMVEGTADEIVQDPVARKYYLGENVAGNIQANSLRRALKRSKEETDEAA